MSTSIVVSSHYFPPAHPSSSALAFQVTCLVDTYMIWVGVADGAAEDVHTAASYGRLTQDWACAMSSSNAAVPLSGTSLFRRSSNAEVALPMAQRLAHRFKKEIFLSVDIPPAFVAMGEGPSLALEVEKGAVELLKNLEGSKG